MWKDIKGALDVLVWCSFVALMSLLLIALLGRLNLIPMRPL